MQNDQDLANEKWNIISLFVMGLEALASSILFVISESLVHVETNDIFKKSSAISLLGTRVVTRNIKTKDIEFKKNDEIFISPHLFNKSFKQSYAFGIGPHSCLGKKLSLLIMDNFKSVYNKEIHKFSKLNYLRNFILKYNTD